MRVVVRWLPACHPDLERWVNTLPGADPERREFARLGLLSTEQHLADTRGEPDKARPVPGYRPAVYWLEFHPGWWMRYCVEDRSRWFRSPERLVTVLLVTDQRPD